jgi:hypothetical protein
METDCHPDVPLAPGLRFVTTSVDVAQVTPESEDRYTRPPSTAAASLVPSADMEMELQALEPAEVDVAQVTPRLVDVWI